MAQQVNNAPFSQCQGGLILGTSSNVFIDLAFSAPLLATGADLAITTLGTQEVQTDFIPTFLKQNDIYSACQNIVKGNYTFTEERNGTIVKTTNLIPYTDEYATSEAILITYYDIITKILFYELPKEFTTQPLIEERSSVSVTIGPDGRIVGQGFIPAIYYSPNKKEDIIVKFEITPVATPTIVKNGTTKEPVLGVEAAMVLKSYLN
jgi:hypothetical protein